MYSERTTYLHKRCSQGCTEIDDDGDEVDVRWTEVLVSVSGGRDLHRDRRVCPKCDDPGIDD
jgi:hypothetical protein